MTTETTTVVTSTETTTNADVEALLAQRNDLKSQLTAVDEQLKAQGTGRRKGKAPTGQTLADSVVTLLREKGNLPAKEIITNLTGNDGGCKDTSVRTLLSTLTKDNKISRMGNRGSYIYTVAG